MQSPETDTGAPGWVERLYRAWEQNHALVLITVLLTQGSTPRDAGARMWVSHDRVGETIGGGNLEWQVIALAREMLSDQRRRHVQRVALGPSLGQCCGGVVWLAFERLSDQDGDWLLAALKAEREGQWAMREVDLAGHRPSTVRCGDRGSMPDVPPWDSDAPIFQDTLVRPKLPVVVCGAGHVGKAVVKLLADLPVDIYWLDPREDIWPDPIPPHVTCHRGGTDELPDLPRQAYWLIMTHSHALDLELVQGVLRDRDPVFLGVIGSDTKRARFVGQLRRRFPDMDLGLLQCPIGLPTVHSRQPAAIAISIVAQLLETYPI